MTEPSYKPPYRIIYAGLVVGVLTQVLVVWSVGAAGGSYFAPGNAAAAIVCLGAIWLIRQRQKGRL